MAEAIALLLDDNPESKRYGASLQLSYENKDVELTEPSIRPPSKTVDDQATGSDSIQRRARSAA
ncbi:hypothetical protein [Halobaculum gomorrense]|uniref:hypothetical protein n=1 Tax=Halobaculum gomorrense TaxID=43928 RepID=UPI0013565920|nr:hypothetical protein [Halobaculum gomorrense]